MDFLEKDLEQVIYDAPDDFLWEKLSLSGKKLRQKRLGNYGISDLIFVKKVYSERLDYDNFESKILDVGLDITICELKKDKVGISAYLQSIRYARAIQRYLIKRNFTNFNLSILLCGSKIDDSGDFIFLTDLFRNYIEDIEFEFNSCVKHIDFYTYNYGFNGLDFKKHEGYRLTNEGF